MMCIARDRKECAGTATHVWIEGNERTTLYSLLCNKHTTAAKERGWIVRRLSKGR